MLKGYFTEFKSRWFWRAVFAEFLGTIFFVFMITSAHISIKPTHANDSVKLSLAYGFSAAVVVKIFGSISGGLINPAISSALYVNGNISSPRATMYSILQYAGAVIGAGITWLLTPSKRRDLLGVVLSEDDVTVAQGFFMEFALTFILTFCVLSCEDRRKEGRYGPPALLIGLAYTSLHFAGMQYTGASFNPARAFGPSLVRNVWDDASWIYWVAPYVASTIAALMYRFIFKPPVGLDNSQSTITTIGMQNNGV